MFNKHIANGIFVHKYMKQALVDYMRHQSNNTTKIRSVDEVNLNFKFISKLYMALNLPGYTQDQEGQAVVGGKEKYP